MKDIRPFSFILIRSSFPKAAGEHFSPYKRSFLGLLEDALHGHGLPEARVFSEEEYSRYSDVRRELSVFRDIDTRELVPVLWAFKDTVLSARREINSLERFLSDFRSCYRMIVVPEEKWALELSLHGMDTDCRTILFEHPSGSEGVPALCLPLRKRYTAEDIRLVAQYLGILDFEGPREDDSTREVPIGNS